MSLRCSCPAQGDEIVFGEEHECTSPEPLEQPWEKTLAPDELED